MRTFDFGKLVFSFTLFLFALAIMILSFGYKPMVRLIPLFISIPTTILLFILFIQDLRSKTDKTREINEIKHKSSFRVFGWIVLYSVLTLFLGFFVCTPFFLFFFLFIEGRLNFKKALINTIISSIVIIVFFNYILKVELWTGLISEIVPKFIGGGILS